MAKLAFERPIIQRINAGLPSKYGLHTHLEPITQIEGIPVAELLRQY
jgi:diaminopimelate decarboxylase